MYTKYITNIHKQIRTSERSERDSHVTSSVRKAEQSVLLKIQTTAINIA